MGWIKRRKKDPLGIDQLFQNLSDSEIVIYQSIFDRVIEAVDLPTQTAWAQSQQYDRAQMDRDEEAMAKIIADEGVKVGVQPMLLQIIVNQYFLADIYMRERDREDWVSRVIHRKDVDYFPAATNVYLMLNAMR